MAGNKDSDDGDERFEIGNDSDLEDEVEDIDSLDRAPPPPYHEDAGAADQAASAREGSLHSGRNLSTSRSRSPAPSHRSRNRSLHSVEGDRASIAHTLGAAEETEEEEEEEEELEEVRSHTVRKGDTVRSISMKYGIDVSIPSSLPLHVAQS